jgi:hypothetical protein
MACLFQIAPNEGLAILDLSSKSLALRPMREEQGMTRCVFKTPLGQNAFVTVFNCSSIFSCETCSRWVQTTTFALPLNPLAISSGRRFQSLRGSSLKDTIGTIAFESDATRRMSDSKLNWGKVRHDHLAKWGTSHHGNLHRYPGGGSVTVRVVCLHSEVLTGESMN